MKFSEAPAFYWLYSLLIGVGASIVLIPKLPLLKVILWSQVVNGVLLPFMLIFMLILINRKDVMGEYRNSKLGNFLAWGTSIIVITLTAAMIWTIATGQ